MKTFTLSLLLLGAGLAIFFMAFPYMALPFIYGYENIFVASDSKVARITHEAVASQDISLCAELPRHKGWDESPRYDCEHAVALAVGDANLCLNTKFDDLCIRDVAIAQSDLQQCEVYSKNPRVGKQIIASQIDSCRMEVIIQNNRFGECATVPLNYPEFGRDGCYSSAAHYKKDSSLCRNIQDPLHREYCVSNIDSYSAP